LTCKIYSIY